MRVVRVIARAFARVKSERPCKAPDLTQMKARIDVGGDFADRIAIS